MAIISRQLGYLFIHAPRTGGTAVATTLRTPRMQGTRIPTKSVQVTTVTGRPRTVRQHISCQQLIQAGLITPAELERLFVFTTVRNPFDSLVSAYLKKRVVRPNRRWATNHPITQSRTQAAISLPFPDYVESQYGSKRPRHMYAAQIDGADLVMRFETLQHDFEVALDQLDVPHRIEIPRINRTERDRDHRLYYTDRAREIVESVFAPDLERFGYEF